MTPKKEWDVINGEEGNLSSLITTYIVPLAAAGAAAGFIGYGFIGVSYFGIRVSGINWGLYQAISMFASALISVIISTLIIDAFAPSFGSEKNMGKSAQLVAYAWTPGLVAGIGSIIPALGGILMLVGLIYGLYLLYIGLPVLKKTPEDKKVIYFVVSLLTIIVTYFVISYILGRILMSVFGLSMGYGNLSL